MAREVLTRKDIEKLNEFGRASRGPGDSTVPTSKDVYFDRLLKYIPAEVVACYIFVTGFIQKLTNPSEINIINWIVFIVFCFLAVLYLWRILKVKKYQQLAICLIAFVVWVFALGGPFTIYDWYDPIYGQILLPIYTLVIAIWEA